MNFIQKNLLEIFSLYKAPQPLSLFLKDFFSTNKKLGSRDRKAIREAVYTYFRWNAFVENTDSPLSLLKWCIENDILKNDYLEKMLEEIPYQDLKDKVLAFPKLSGNLTQENYINYLHHQPSLFIRIEKKKEASVQKKLKDFQQPLRVYPIPNSSYNILELSNGFPIQQYLKAYEYIVQDYASQMTVVKAFSCIEGSIKNIWDVCSGAGGKSILISQLFSPQKILAFDIRPQILHNLQKRIRQYRIQNIETITHDWSKKAFNTGEPISADVIVCDVPCSGSGTWARVPENISHALETPLEALTTLQASILQNVIQNAQEGTSILYITCSVFYEENEAQIEKMKELFSIEILRQEFIFGEEYHSDSMFFCLFQIKS